LKDAFDFYWVKFILKLHYPRGWRIDSLDPIKVVFNPDDPRHTRPVAWDLFPKTKMRDMFKIDGQFGIDLDLKFQIPIQVAAGAPLPIGEVGPKAKVSFLIGPWNYSFKKASILSSGELDCEACWRIHDSYELLNSGDLQINMIMKKLEAVNAVKADVSFEGKMSTGYFLWKNELPIEGSQTIKLLPQP
jgi:hypothetical protein